MGTRGALGFIKDGKHKVTYNHFDSYPSGLGNDILEFIKDNSLNTLKQLCDNITLVKEDSTPTDLQIQHCKNCGTVDLHVGEQSETDWYCLLREAQGDLKKYGQVGFMVDMKNFLQDDLFCEYAYIINLDNATLEVFCGAQPVNTFKLNDLPKDPELLVPNNDEED